MEEKRVKITEMKIGYTYTFTDMSIEEYYYGVYGFELPVVRGRVYNTGVLMFYPRKNSRGDKYEVCLFCVNEGNQLQIGPSTSGRGVGLYNTGRKCWYEDKGFYVNRPLPLDAEVIEVNPFPILRVRKGESPLYYPDPWNMVSVPANTPYEPHGIDYVDTWDSTDIKICVALGVVSFICLFGGPELWSFSISTWIFAAIGFRVKHNRIRKEVLEEREKLGVRGSGCDSEFRRKVIK